MSYTSSIRFLLISYGLQGKTWSTEEGGLGIRNWKIWRKPYIWNLFGNSCMEVLFELLFFRANYRAQYHPFLLDHSSYKSLFLKALKPLVKLVIRGSGWIIIEGKIFFWFENWSSLGILGELSNIADPSLTVAEVNSAMGGNWEKIRELVGSILCDKLKLKNDKLS